MNLERFNENRVTTIHMLYLDSFFDFAEILTRSNEKKVGKNHNQLTRIIGLTPSREATP
jgi:hypothetical protein